MVSIDRETASKYFIIGVFIVTIILSWMLIKPFVTTILTSMLFAYLFHPVYIWLKDKINNQNLAALIVTILILILIMVPTVFILLQTTKEVQVGYVTVKQMLSSGRIFPEECNGGIFCPIVKNMGDFVNGPEVKFYIQDSIQQMTQSLTSKSVDFLYSVPGRLFDLLITFFMIFYLLVDGERLVKFIEDSVPLKSKQRKMIFRKMHEVTHAIIYGVFIIAVVEAIIAMLTFALFGVTSPVLWGLMVGILTFIPLIGGTVIYVPAMLFKFIDGDITAVVGILIGGLIISFVDTFIKPKMIGNKSKVHPVLMILGLLGGIKFLGVVGIVFGPLILALLVTFFEMYKKSSKRVKKKR